MGRILARRDQGLRKLSPDLISKARDETATQVTRLGLTFFGTAAFCLLSLLSPDATLLGGSEKINVPFAGPVSFLGFMVLGPTVLLLLRVSLQIYVEHNARLDRLARSVSVVRAPTLVPLQNSLIRLFSASIFYLLLPVTMLLFAWKAAVFPSWGLGLFGVAVAVIVSHAALLFHMLPRSDVSLVFGIAVADIVGRVSTSPWRSKVLLSVSAAIIAMVVAFGFGGLRRPFYLYRASLLGLDLGGGDLRSANLIRASLSSANLSHTNLLNADLSGANLLNADLSGANLLKANVSGANLNGAILSSANLSDTDLLNADLGVANLRGANLFRANLRGANLFRANLRGASLNIANLSGANLGAANLSDADLSSANLSGANLSGARNLEQMQLDNACGNVNTTLPKGLKLQPCVP
jgi:uncharacterized protein YjbI with pentapeptide repeats